MQEFSIKTTSREECIDITDPVRNIVKKENIDDGICFLFVCHTTAALSITETADQNVGKDILHYLKKSIPKGRWLHDAIDNNADAHIKAAIIKPSLAIPFRAKELLLGRWQRIVLLEFDGPRTRKIVVRLL